jgi:hypothetical protein
LILPLLLAALVAISGCASAPSVLAPHRDLPADCAALRAEMIALAADEAATQNALYLRDLITSGLSTAVGFLPTAWTWSPLAAMLLIQPHDGSERFQALSLAYLARGCAPSDTGDL